MKRAIWIVLTLIGLAVIVSAASILMLYAVFSREPDVARQSTLVLRPGGQLHEIAPNDVFGQVVGRGGVTIRSLVENLRKARRDPRISSVLLIPTALDAPFWAKVQELRDAIVDFRRSGKTVIAFLQYGGDREYYLATAADRIFLLPTSSLDITGVASYEIFLRGTLDKIGTYPDFLHIGEYKTAPNQLTERTFTPAHREMAESLNRNMYEQLVRDVADARRKTSAEVRTLLDQGPFLPDAAVKAGLVDDLAYEDQLDDKVRQLRSEGREVRRIEGSEYQRISDRSVGFRPRSRIAVIYIAGAIASGESRFDPINGPIAGSDTIVEQIRRVREDDSIKAIILRIDSPGGSSAASDIVWRELMITRDERPSRPLLVSMSDLAASGGYYIALPGQAIVAEPATLTGSIGIYGGKMVAAGTLSKLGINLESIASGRQATMQSPLERYTTEQRAKMEAIMRGFYTQFLEKVATSRRMTPDRVDAIARGRVWTGAQAKDLGLVDALGGLEMAVRMARERASIPADEDVELVAYPARRSLYELLAGRFRSERTALSPWMLLPLRIPMAASEMFRRGEILALMPYAFSR